MAKKYFSLHVEYFFLFLKLAYFYYNIGKIPDGTINLFQYL